MGSLRVRHDWVASLSRIRKVNGNPLQRSCLENPRDGGAWWAAVYGVAQSWTWLKRLSSSSSRSAGSYGSSIFTFLWNLHTFSIVAVSIYIPTSSTGWVRKIVWSRKWQSTQVFLPGKFHGQRSLAGYNPWGCKQSDMTEHSCTAMQEGSFFSIPSLACIVCRLFDDGHSD